jgi:hypothetical protein
VKTGENVGKTEERKHQLRLEEWNKRESDWKNVNNCVSWHKDSSDINSSHHCILNPKEIWRVVSEDTLDSDVFDSLNKNFLPN